MPEDARILDIFAIGSSVPAPQAQIVTDESSVMNNDVNNVDIDREMSLVAKNQLNYNFYVQQMNHDVKMMRIGDRREIT